MRLLQILHSQNWHCCARGCHTSRIKVGSEAYYASMPAEMIVHHSALQARPSSAIKGQTGKGL